MNSQVKRKWDTGMERPYRPMPVDFRETYLLMGWDGIEEHYGTNYRCIRRWIDEAGGEDLRKERAAITGSAPKPHLRSKRAKRYVMGLTLTAVKNRGEKG